METPRSPQPLQDQMKQLGQIGLDHLDDGEDGRTTCVDENQATHEKTSSRWKRRESSEWRLKTSYIILRSAEVTDQETGLGWLHIWARRWRLDKIANRRRRRHNPMYLPARWGLVLRLNAIHWHVTMKTSTERTLSNILVYKNITLNGHFLIILRKLTERPTKDSLLKAEPFL